MPEPKRKIPLAIGNCVADLNKHAQDVKITIKTPTQCQQYCKSVNDIFKKAEAQYCDGDEERSYMLFMRYFYILEVIKGTYEYQKHKKFYDEILIPKNALTAIERAESLSTSLKQRYRQLQEDRSASQLEKAEKAISTAQNTAKKNKSVPDKSKENSNELSNSKLQNDKLPKPSTQEEHHMIDSFPDIPSSNDHKSDQDIINSIGKPKSKCDPWITPEELYEVITQADPNSLKKFVIIVDADSKRTDVTSDADIPIRVLKNAIYKSGGGPDSVAHQHSLETEPRLLDSGFSGWFLYYPSKCTNPFYKKPKPKVMQTIPDAASLLSNLNYPTLPNLGDRSISESALNQPLNKSISTVNTPENKFDRSMSESASRNNPRPGASADNEDMLEKLRRQISSPQFPENRPMTAHDRDDPFKHYPKEFGPTIQASDSFRQRQGSLDKGQRSSGHDVADGSSFKRPPLGTHQQSGGNSNPSTSPSVKRRFDPGVDPGSNRGASESLILPPSPLASDLSQHLPPPQSPLIPPGSPILSSSRSAGVNAAKPTATSGFGRASDVGYHGVTQPQRQISAPSAGAGGIGSARTNDPAGVNQGNYSHNTIPRRANKDQSTASSFRHQLGGPSKSMPGGPPLRPTLPKPEPESPGSGTKDGHHMPPKTNQVPPSRPPVGPGQGNHNAASIDAAQEGGGPTTRAETGMGKPLTNDTRIPNPSPSSAPNKIQQPLSGHTKPTSSTDRDPKTPTTPAAEPEFVTSPARQKDVAAASQKRKAPDIPRSGSVGKSQHEAPPRDGPLSPDVDGERDFSLASSKEREVTGIGKKSKMKRSLSTPNLADLDEDKENSMEEKQLQEKPQRPVIDRSSKPFVQDNKQFVDRSTKPLSKSRLTSLSPVYGSKGRNLTGLKNLGNTCYMNSVIQSLSNTTPFALYFCNGNYAKNLNPHSMNRKPEEVAKELAFLVKVLWSGQYRSVSPCDFKSAVGRFATQFAGTKQQDAHEFLMFFMDGIHEDTNKVRKKTAMKEQKNDGIPESVAAANAWKDYTKNNDSIVVDLFQGQFRSTVSCKTCLKKSITFDVFSCLPLQLTSKSSCSLQECIRSFTRPELIGGHNSWKCSNCKVYREATKTIEIWKLPPVIIIQLKRFSSDGIWHNKLQTNVNFSINDFNITQMSVGVASGGRSHAPYNLFAVINHYGNFDSGHYTAYCRNKGNWYCYDDNVVRDIDANSVKEQISETMEMLEDLTEEELHELNNIFDPENNLLPINERMTYQCSKQPSRQFNKDLLSKHLETAAAESTVGKDYIPFVKAEKDYSNHTLAIPSLRPVARARSPSPLPDLTKEELDCIENATEDELVEVAAMLKMNELVTAEQVESVERGRKPSASGILRPTLVKTQYPIQKSFSIDEDDDIEEAVDVDAMVKALRSKNEDISIIVCNNQPYMDPEVLEEIAAHLLANKNIRHLSLANCNVTDSVIDSFAEALESNTKLETINLESNFITPVGVKKILDAIQDNKTLREIRLENQYSKIGPKAETQMADCVAKNFTLLNFGYSFETRGPRDSMNRYILRNNDLLRNARKQGKAFYNLAQEKKIIAKFKPPWIMRKPKRRGPEAEIFEGRKIIMKGSSKKKKKGKGHALVNEMLNKAAEVSKRWETKEKTGELHSEYARIEEQSKRQLEEDKIKAQKEEEKHVAEHGDRRRGRRRNKDANGEEDAAVLENGEEDAADGAMKRKAGRQVNGEVSGMGAATRRRGRKGDGDEGDDDEGSGRDKKGMGEDGDQEGQGESPRKRMDKETRMKAMKGGRVVDEDQVGMGGMSMRGRRKAPEYDSDDGMSKQNGHDDDEDDGGDDEEVTAKTSGDSKSMQKVPVAKQIGQQPVGGLDSLSMRGRRRNKVIDDQEEDLDALLSSVPASGKEATSTAAESNDKAKAEDSSIRRRKKNQSEEEESLDDLLSSVKKVDKEKSVEEEDDNEEEEDQADKSDKLKIPKGIPIGSQPIAKLESLSLRGRRRKQDYDDEEESVDDLLKSVKSVDAKKQDENEEDNEDDDAEEEGAKVGSQTKLPTGKKIGSQKVAELESLSIRERRKKKTYENEDEGDIDALLSSVPKKGDEGDGKKSSSKDTRVPAGGAKLPQQPIGDLGNASFRERRRGKMGEEEDEDETVNVLEEKSREKEAVAMESSSGVDGKGAGGPRVPLPSGKALARDKIVGLETLSFAERRRRKKLGLDIVDDDAPPPAIAAVEEKSGAAVEKKDTAAKERGDVLEEKKAAEKQKSESDTREAARDRRRRRGRDDEEEDESAGSRRETRRSNKQEEKEPEKSKREEVKKEKEVKKEEVKKEEPAKPPVIVKVPEKPAVDFSKPMTLRERRRLKEQGLL
eukprot:gene19517-21447_t